ncbi:probable cytochrome P450 28d1 [Fopius arisanus]|uniref:Cyp28d1_0 protein n=1 Tax=Fopius arisanus TaxID=64838 RepID=A0A0C9RZB4_9HYME|nr:PREDICTED: probable cytochrome P450 28d1 [Fopius arisanus]
METSIYIMSVLILSILVIYKYLTRNNGYWKSQGISEGEGALLGFGHALDQVLSIKNTAMLIESFHKAHPHDSMIGIYIGPTPVLILRDPELIKFVLTTGFSNFSENLTLNEELDPLMSHDPFFQNGKKWKNSRGIFLTAFSSKKLRDMIPAINATCQKMVKYLKGQSTKSIEIEVKDLFSKYTLGVAASVIFSIEDDTFDDKIERHSLRKMMDAIFSTKRGLSFKKNLMLLFPASSRFFTNRYLPEWVNTFFMQMVDDIKSMRTDEKMVRTDILEHISDYLRNKSLSEDELAGHAFGFLLEMYETSSLTLSHMCYFVAKYPRIQEKMRNEVDDVIGKHGTISYEAINDMTYVEQVLRETLRFFPPIGSMMRICCKPVNLKGPDGLSCNLKLGDQLRISVSGLHMDPLHWQNPEAFIPERFGNDNEDQRKKFVYLPFGEGPRSCPGIRMTGLQIKTVMAAVLRDFFIEKSDRMEEPIKVDSKHFVTAIDGGVWVQLKSRY